MRTVETMRYFRIFAAVVMTGVSAFILLPNAPKALLFMTTWGFLLTNCYFLVGIFEHSHDKMKKVTPKYYALIWGLNWTISLIYWTLLFTSDPNPLYKRVIFHSFPIVLTVIEFPYNRAMLKRKHFLIMIAFVLIYFAFYCVTTLINGKGAYTGIDFTNFIIVFMIVLNFIISLAALEVGRIIKNKIAQKSTESTENADYVEIQDRKSK
ncbi:hypothetical protein SteCoe_1828 [Stentor coeruleus]|uniref:Uncharacterized protein n=1 Tax=Stentor coeruleus TaxID=5963 RepID=A0A1R2D141_9CILI|nr:hypothetical protein SteCoe_1828 [Stentor coeruleus]